jgi:glycosyltransferase involved in cell wall biosynthesis
MQALQQTNSPVRNDHGHQPDKKSHQQPDFRDKPLVSVMMTVYNSAQFLGAAIDSILSQTYPHFEFLIVDDGSTDNSASIVKSYQDSRIVFMENPGNRGIVYSRNRILTAAKGKYIAVLDSDDIALPNRLEKQVEFLENNTEYGMCGSYFRVINHRGQRMYNVKFPVTDKELKTYLWFGNSFCHSTVLMNTEIARQSMYPESFPLGEDYALWQYFAQVSRIYNLPVYTTLYRVHGHNVSTRKYAEMFEKIKIINGNNLTHFGFPYTEADLDIYSHFIFYDYRYFKDKQQFMQLKSLLQRIIKHLKADSEFDIMIVLKLFLDRWFVICYKTRHFDFFFFNKLVIIDTKYLISYLYDLLVNTYRKRLVSVSKK